jgi:6-pyruvoyltetrahydropterin/6-carboxytetrahydropterin synthase
MFELTVTMEFSAAHRLRGYEGACERLHGHNYKVDATLESEKLDKLGMAMDFKAVKAALADILDRVDHQFLNETGVFKEINPTAENIAKWIADELAGKLPSGVGVKSVTVWESDRCGATYRP